MRVIISAGGTGGHIYPALSIINKIKQRDKNAEILYQTKEEIMEMLDYINIVLLRLSRNNIKYTNCIKIVENTKKRLRQNANYDMCIDNLLFNMWEEIV